LIKDYNVIVLTRNLKGKKAEKNLSYALWDIKKQEIDILAIRAADCVVHLAGAGVVDKKWTDAYKKEIIDSRTKSSQLLFEALKANDNKIKTVVSASAVGWYGADNASSKPFTENDEAATGFLGDTCKLWEASIDPVTTLGKRLVKCRIGIVLSNDGGALSEFKKPLPLGVAAILGTGKQIISWIHIDDLCSIFIKALDDENLNGVYNAVAPNPVTNKTLTKTLAKTINGRFYIPVQVPAFVLKIMMGQRSIEVLKSTTVSCAKILETGFSFTYPDIESALLNLAKK
jgi:uncharacterized protein (TIGR01777 family)